MTHIDASYKGFPGHLAPVSWTQVGQQGWALLDGDLSLPLAVLKQTALEHNLTWMRQFCETRHLDIAPHGKTSISHPCTTFDKWRWMPLVDDHYKVIDAISIHF